MGRLAREPEKKTTSARIGAVPRQTATLKAPSTCSHLIRTAITHFPEKSINEAKTHASGLANATKSMQTDRAHRHGQNKTINANVAPKGPCSRTVFLADGLKVY